MPGQHVLEDGRVVLERAFELHAELAQRAAGDHRHPVVDARRDERAGDHERVDRRGAERLDVAPARLGDARRLGDRLAEVASAALVPIADRLLAGADHVLDGRGVDAGRRQEMPGRVHRARPCTPGSPGARAADSDSSESCAGRERADHLVPVEQGQLAEPRLLLQAHQLELVELGQELVERELIDDVAERAARVAGRRRSLHQGRGRSRRRSGSAFPMNTWFGG